MGDGPEATYKIGNATVRIHGKIDPDKLKAATVEFLKSAERQKKSKKTCRERSINGNSNSIYTLCISQYDHLLDFVQNKDRTKSDGMDA